MVWTFSFEERAAKEFKKLGRDEQVRISNYIRKRILLLENPLSIGKPLKYGFVGLWRYRVEKIRIICSIDQEKKKILALAIGKRDKIYASI